MATGTAVTDYVVRVYDTKALAETGNDADALKVVSSTNPTISNQYQDNDDHFHTFQRYYIRIESPEPVKGMYIDWDDGEDNSIEKSNSEWKMFETPKTYGIFEHIFTKHDTFYPLIRLQNTMDFKSKYYTPNGGNHTALDSVTITTGQQGTSMVSIDSTSVPRIPIFKPSNMPPTGVLKLSKNRIYSGIDNDNIAASKMLYAYYDGTLASFTTVKLTYEDTQGRISQSTITPTDDDDAHTLATGKAAPSHTGAIFAKKLLAAELVNMTEGSTGLNTADRIYIKTGTVGSNAADSRTDKTVTILSLGSPIQKERDAMYSLLADGSESKTRASNRTISEYLFDNDKLSVAGAVQSSTLIDEGDAKEGEISDVLVAGLSNSTVGQKTFSYTFGNEVNQPKDSTGRFYDEQRLIRLQVKDNHTGVAGDQFTKSKIESFTRNGTNGIYGPYSDIPDASHTRKQPTSLNHEALLMFTNQDGTSTGTNWQELSTRNFTDNLSIINNLTSADNYTLTTTAEIDTHPENYLLITKTEKFDKIHVRVNNLKDFDEEGEVRIVAWYAGKRGANVVWKPLKIIDGTTAGGDKTSLYRSGTISFNRPEDWTATTADGMYGGTPASGTDTWTKANNSPVLGENSNVGPITAWNFSGYGLMLGICAITTDEDNQLQVANVWPYNNSHSQPLTIVDPHHVSLNAFAIAQSISFGRNTKTRSIESRLGVTDIQKIGAAGGSIKFGSPDFGTNRKTFKEYQQNATPVYLDVTHKNSEITRFYGIITKMSEDHPLGKMTRKYSVSMEIAYIVELNSDGTMLSDGRIALGGKITNEPKYIL